MFVSGLYSTAISFLHLHPNKIALLTSLSHSLRRTSSLAVYILTVSFPDSNKMSWRPDSPVTVPDGRLVCGMHGLVICGSCCADYSLMEDSDIEDEDLDGSDAFDVTPSPEDMNEGPADLVNTPGVGTGRVIPTKSNPPNDNATPQSLFPPGISTKAIPPVRRFIRRTGPAKFLIYTDGSCLNNGQANSIAGCSFVFKPLV